MKFLAAAIQMLATDDKAANLKEAEHEVRRAAAQGARLIALTSIQAQLTGYCARDWRTR